MRTRRALYPEISEMYICELEQCPSCKKPLSVSRYSSGHKIVQNLSSTVEIGYWPKQCDNPATDTRRDTLDSMPQALRI